MDMFLFVRGGFGSGDLNADLVLEGLCVNFELKTTLNTDMCNRVACPLDVRCHHAAFQLQKGTVSLNVQPSMLLKTACLCLSSNCNQWKAVGLSSATSASPSC